jgi:hypothetical protein
MLVDGIAALDPKTAVTARGLAVTMLVKTLSVEFGGAN